MSAIDLTPNQEKAVRATGRSVIVSAAAGSGKTAVLARRCAYLVCDAPEGVRCDADELLVVTFTEAAAAQMRSRVVEALRDRLRERPDDDRLRRQAALVDIASISTIHSFCRWLVQRYFSEAGLDPAAVMLDQEEADLIQAEVLDSLFETWYEEVREPQGATGSSSARVLSDNTGGQAASGTQPASDAWATSLGVRFVQLVEDYGLGRDTGIAEVIRRLSDFVGSLPDPNGWLDDARERVEQRPGTVVAEAVAALRSELDRQRTHCLDRKETIDPRDPRCALIADAIGEYVAALDQWGGMLAEGDAGTVSAGRGSLPAREMGDAGSVRHGGRTLQFDRVRELIGNYDLKKPSKARRSKRDDPPTQAALDGAIRLFDEVKKSLFQERLQRRFGRFTSAEWLDGLERTAPYVATIVELVKAYRSAYAARKRQLDVLDFADLERFAYDLLAGGGNRVGDNPALIGSEGCCSAVARAMQKRFAHVLVDEFQDINPLQAEIIRLVSRESDPSRPGNLFVVGDVKQSIYRFRLAEAAVFMDRWNRVRDGAQAGAAIPLQKNFRSRPEVVDVVNLVFAQLMRLGSGPVVYDEDAYLRLGREDYDNTQRCPVELHLLQRNLDVSDDGEGQAPSANDLDGDEPLPFDPADPARWNPIEREAFCIGARIKELMTHGAIKPGGKPLCYRDVAVLLRSAKVNAGQLASTLSAMGIPAFANAGGAFLEALEVREMLAALQVLDNAQQDIPLASVLRTGIFGEVFNEDDLVEIRCHDRGIPFHAVVRAYADAGENADLRARLGRFFDCIERYRDAVRRRPLAEFLWELYDRSAYLAYVGGMVNGPERRANLIKLHELARKFGTFRRQGLHRFLRFIELLKKRDHDLPGAAAVGEAEDVVRVMTIHSAKGLEFPVVFIAGLATALNLRDRSGRILFERSTGLGLRVVDPERMIEYPTVAHQLVVDEIERTAREEELRVLYVAMTRARDKLILLATPRAKSLTEWVGERVGQDERSETCRHHPERRGDEATKGGGRHEGREGRNGVGQDERSETCRPPGAHPRQSPLSNHAVQTASSMLDWLMPVFASAHEGVVQWPEQAASDNAIVQVTRHEAEEILSWTVGREADPTAEQVREAVANLAPLPASEPILADHPRVEAVSARMEAVYPTLASASVRAVMGASEFKGAYDFTRNPEERAVGAGLSTTRSRRGKPFVISTAKTEAENLCHTDPRQRGLATHRVLQHIGFAAAAGDHGVEAELDRLTGGGLLSADERKLVDTDELAWFMSTPLAEAIRRAGANYHREFAYIASEDPQLFDESVGQLDPEDLVLVRGIVDGVVVGDDTLDIVDFKTDRVFGEDVSARALQYHSQMALYSRAMARLWRRPVGTCHLVFLAPRTIVPVDPLRIVDCGLRIGS